MADAISLSQVSVTLPGSARPVLRDVDLTIDEGELALVVGRTGSGKSTLLGAMCGRVPHFTGGTLTGHVRLHGRDTRDHRPRDLADLVGVVGQDPLAGFVTDTVEEELAYGMEQLGLPAATMRKRVEETLDLLGIAELRDVPLRELSGGQQQRVAIGSVLTAHPRVILLDEPTSALDPTGAEEVLATITRLVHDLAVTVVVAEHRVERVLHYADTVVHVSPSGEVRSGLPSDLMVDSDIAPPVVELGRYAGWSPLPLSVRDARRAAGGLRARLVATLPPGPDRPAGQGSPTADVGAVRAGRRGAVPRRRARRGPGRPRPARRRGHRHDGPQRLRQVVPALGAPGQRPPDLRHGPGHPGLRNGRTERPWLRENVAHWWGSCRRPRPTCSTSTPSAPSATRPTARAACPAAPARSCSRRWPPASPRSSTPATCPKARSWPSCWPCS